jgi:hypothetical protein
VNKTSKVIFVTETWRSEERQKELISLWLSKVARSNHQDWLAIDIWFFWSELYPSDFSKWRKVADIAKKYWIDWWFDLWKWDKPHFQESWKPLQPSETNISKSRFSDIMTAVLKETNLNPLFEKHEWNQPLTEQETRELIEIAFARFYKKYIQK